MPAPVFWPNQQGITMWFPDRDFSRIVDMLRNEKRVYFYWGEDMQPIIRTGSEPIGEEEKSRVQGTLIYLYAKHG